MNNIFWSKFVKAFLTGGVVAVSATLASGVSISNIAEGKHLLAVLVLAFLSGAFHGLYNVLFPPTVQ